MSRRSILIVLISGFCFYSCNKDKWNEPSKVSFIMDINRSSGLGGKLAFSEGNIVLESFSFEGNRVQGDDVYFTNSYPSGLNIAFNQTTTVGDLNFDIPQGTFTRIQVSFSTFESTSNNHIEISGTYISGINNTYPIRFEFDAKESFSVLAQNTSGTNEIILEKEKQMTPRIIIDPIYWFQPVSQNLINNADLVDVNGTMTILITSTTNIEIYDIIANRIGDGVKIYF